MLQGKRILQVDDSQAILDLYQPELVKASGGTAEGLLHASQTLEELANQILEQNPDVLLLDGYLANGLFGDDLIPLLKQKGFAGQIIGFSMVSSFTERFAAVGAEAVVKDTKNPQASIDAVERLVQ